MILQATSSRWEQSGRGACSASDNKVWHQCMQYFAYSLGCRANLGLHLMDSWLLISHPLWLATCLVFVDRDGCTCVLTVRVYCSTLRKLQQQ